jgi:hypothetical protein
MVTNAVQADGCCGFVSGLLICLHTGNWHRSLRPDDKSRMNREVHVRICEGLRGKCPWSTRQQRYLAWFSDFETTRLRLSVAGILESRDISKSPEPVGAINCVTLHEIAVFRLCVGMQGDICIAPSTEKGSGNSSTPFSLQRHPATTYGASFILTHNSLLPYSVPSQSSSNTSAPDSRTSQ